MALPTASDQTTALVTGASSGIGTEFAKALAARGQHLTLAARRADRLEALAAELRERWAVTVDVEACDLNDPAARRDLLDAIAARGRRVSILVNNAGFSTVGRTSAAERDRELAMVRTNVEAVVDLTTMVLPTMVEAGSGALLNVASTAGVQPVPGQAGYGATKAFVLSYTEAIAAELKGSPVTATVLCPGPVETEFADAAGFEEGDTETLGKVFWVDAADVAEQAVAGMAEGKRRVMPGFANRSLAAVAQHTPRGPLLSVLARIHPALKRG